jgi:DNA polymerase-1
MITFWKNLEKKVLISILIGFLKNMEINPVDVLVIDGASMAHRAGHVIQDLSSSKGENTSVVFGLLKMLRALVEKHHPTEVCICWDYHGSASKKHLYPEYKKRPRKEEDFAIYNMVNQQIMELYNILPAFGIKQLRIEGIEGDDLVGIIAKYLGSTGKLTMVVSSDHDLWQLVNFPCVVVYHPQKDLVLEATNFIEKVGFRPEMWVWFRSLTGDPGDNIKGLKWFGEKTAKVLLEKFGFWSSWWDAQGKFINFEVLCLLNKRQKESILALDAFETLSISYALTKVGMLDAEREPEIITSYESQVPEFNEEAIKSYFLDKEFGSFLAKFHSFIHPFRRMVLHGKD